ncbi:GL16529 [Drosophila persimilis]|uniref:GL16529 n=1 Tax=Drosophila persimilis TaxID=7234 RepID=B4GWC2_DROPE|nr:GL16529 [Drosophila persimilis]
MQQDGTLPEDVDQKPGGAQLKRIKRHHQLIVVKVWPELGITKPHKRQRHGAQQPRAAPCSPVGLEHPLLTVFDWTARV